MTDDERGRDIEVSDYMGRLYNKLGELGCRGGISNTRVDDAERHLHNYAWGYILGTIGLGDFKTRINKFFRLYKEEHEHENGNDTTGKAQNNA